MDNFLLKQGKINAEDRGLLRVTDDPEEAVRIMLDCFIEAEMKREAAPHNLATPLDIPNRPT